MTDPIQFFKTTPDATIPSRATSGSAGFDLHSTISFTLRPGARCKFPIGIKCAIPPGWTGLIFPRSGWSANFGLNKLAGVVDSDYREEVHAVLLNSGEEDIEIRRGDRIAQMVVVPFLGNAIEVDELDETDRTGGFGSTGR